MKFKKTLIAVLAVATLTGCEMTDNQKTAMGAVVGGVVGGVAGHQVHHKNGRYVGAALGALAGGGVTMYMNKRQKMLQDSPALKSAGVGVSRHDNGTIKLSLPNAITFATNSDTLNSGVYQSLNDIVNVISQSPETAVHVLGFTDSTGSDQHNLQLSQRRAQAVSSYLSSRGVRNPIVPNGYGESHPVASNASESGKAQNRRAEIYIRAIQQGNEQAAYAPIL